MRINYCLFLLICLFPFSGEGQVIDNTLSTRDMNGDKYVRFHYENDFFTATDYYYTQGVNIEYVNPVMGNFILSKILPKPSGSKMKYGLAFEQDGYTPSSIRHNEILYNDRPFAGCMMLKLFSMANDSLKQRRISGTLSLGVIGRLAQGENIQEYIHKHLHNIAPLGWSHQIHNDLIFNYELGLEKKIMGLGNLFVLNSHSVIRIGTLSDKIEFGCIAMLGNTIKPFSSQNKSFSFHFFEHPELNFVGYDATMQGGIFNPSSPYIIASKDISRVVFQNDLGVVTRVGNLYMEYFQSYISQEFNQGKFHRWGGIRIGVSF